MIRKAERDYFIRKIREEYADDLMRQDSIPPDAIDPHYSSNPQKWLKIVVRVGNLYEGYDLRQNEKVI